MPNCRPFANPRNSAQRQFQPTCGRFANPENSARRYGDGYPYCDHFANPANRAREDWYSQWSSGY